MTTFHEIRETDLASLEHDMRALARQAGVTMETPSSALAFLRGALWDDWSAWMR